MDGAAQDSGPRPHDLELVRYLNLKLVALGQPHNRAVPDPGFLELATPLLRNHLRKDELLGWPLCPVDQRIQAFLDAYLLDVRPKGAARLPARTLVLDRAGLGRALSLPTTSDRFASPYVTSYRLAQGVLHNPKSDRRTTQGVFHVAEGGLPVPLDKCAVPKFTFAALLDQALRPPDDALVLPFTQGQADPARVFVSLLLRPLVCPRTDRTPEKSMEVRFFAPGSLVSNLDFVEAIFGNGGDPFLPENDAVHDLSGFSGHTGCVILAPHLVGMKKVDLGLPPYEQATERQRRDGMCYRSNDEPYNDGRAFKITCRDARGVIVTIIADNYYGYCKKEVKTQISYATNLFGGCEEEHSGGALAFASYVLGQEFAAAYSQFLEPKPFETAMALLGDRVVKKPERFAVDRVYPDVFYVPEDAEFKAREGYVRWTENGSERRLTLRAEAIYVLPNGYRIRLEKQLGGMTWRMVGTRPDGVLCHKPCTVSGGGKSEISKSLRPMILSGPLYVRDFKSDMEQAAAVIERDYANIHRQPESRSARPFLSRERTLGSVIKLLTPSEEYTDEHNAWVRALPQTIRQLVFVIKRHYRADWGTDFRSHFSVDRVNGYPGHELRFDGQRLMTNYLRVGFEDDEGTYRVFKLRPDFRPSDKVQVEDDITASTVVPRERVPGLSPEYPNPSVKLVANCEFELFQRPDDAILRGFDHQAEADIATPGTFITNFEPLTREQARALEDRVIEFDRYTEPMKRLLSDFVRDPAAGYVVSSAHPRLVNGKPSKNPRYLQRRPDRVAHRETHVAEIGMRLSGDIAADQPFLPAVHAVLAGRRANRENPAIGLPPLAVYGPIHYQELPELFMDFLTSLTGKSPSTTGFGSEGALTKGPFNALWPVVDMNNALVSAIVTGYGGFTTVAGYLGPRCRIDHDISMLVPEIWCRMSVRERTPSYLVENGYLAKIEDYAHGGTRILASRLGYRITPRFVDHFLGRIFETPSAVFPRDLLEPELQDPDAFAAGVQAISEAQARAAQEYLDSGSVAAACPPLRALIHVMATGAFEGRTIEDPAIRRLFSRESMVASDWYRERLHTKQARDRALLVRHRETLARRSGHGASADVAVLKHQIEAELERVSSPAYIDELVGTLGADPFHGQLPG